MNSPSPSGVRASVWLLTLALALLSGCANPGPPLPPSLKLPEIPADVTATRVGDQVILRWTTPAQTTDKIDIVNPDHAITAQLCWEEAAAAASSGPQSPRSPAPCHPTLLVAVRPGATEAVDTLAPSLATGPSRMIGYRVELRNVHGRSAGLSAPAAVAAGAPLPPVDELRATAGRNGATLEWAQAPATSTAPSAQFVELTRIQVGAPPGASQTAGITPAAKSPQSAIPTGPREPKEIRLKVATASADVAPGALDRTAKVGYTYTYTAQRVRTVLLAGQQVEQRSAPSAVVTVAMRDIFPPGPPTGLAASPGFTSEVVPRPAIDLSWQPSPDTRIAGYRVYRTAAGQSAKIAAATLLTSSPVATLAFRDATVAPGSPYMYFVTAVDTAGNESSPSQTVNETAPTP